jgi:3-phenylpropionate/trans-cinnamate dioxygenase ferredoxin subunit
MSAGSSITVCPLDEIPSGTARKVDVAGIAVSIVRIGDDVYALGDVCTHADVSLSEGEVWCDELEIECPKHGSAFSLLTGEPSTLPATQPVPVFDASVVDGQIVVTVSIDPPTIDPPTIDPPTIDQDGVS